MATVTDLNGDVIYQSSGGKLQFKGARKSTPFAATQIGIAIGREMVSMGVKEADINLQGLGGGRDALVRAVQGAGINVRVLRDVNSYSSLTAFVHLRSVVYVAKYSATHHNERDPEAHMKTTKFSARCS